MLTSDYAFVLMASSSSAKLLGFNLNENRNSKGSIAIDATQKGSVVNLGKEGAVNGSIYLSNYVAGHDAVNFYSGN